jgi:hypothetical protein
MSEGSKVKRATLEFVIGKGKKYQKLRINKVIGLGMVNKMIGVVKPNEQKFQKIKR